MTFVLDYIDKSLRYVPNDRRKIITLGEFLSKHHYLNANALQEFNSDILKTLITKVLGETQNLSSTDIIDW